jgi:putative oxidoreductase
MSNARDVAALIGRILIALMYIPAGWSKIGGFAGTSGYIASRGLPLPDVGAAIAIVVELVGGILLLIGWKTRWTALALAAFTLVATFFFHNFWAYPADQAFMQTLLFDKNIAIVGGLLLAYAFGPGRYSVDKP